jgi:hypothetical protein
MVPEVLMSLPARLLTFFTYTLVAVGPALPTLVCADVPSGEASNQVLIDWSAFADTYYSYNLNNLPTRNRPYTTQPLYNEELALNLGYIDAKVSGDRVRGRLAAQYGSSVVENYAREPELFWRYIQEANAGYKLSEQVWIDAGIFLSHIGLEGWISRENWTYTRSLIADYSPYYQSGAKVSYQASKELAASVHVLHGWQNISDDRDPALGTQVSYQPNDSTSFVYNTFLGNEQGNRFFNDLIAKRQISKSLSIGTSFDIGFQERKVEQDTVAWHGWALLAQYKVYSALRVAGRVEGYSDPHQVIITSLSGNHVTATGLSVNVDVDLTTELLWRTEYRVLLSSEKVFPRASGFSDSESMVVTSLAYALGSYSD